MKIFKGFLALSLKKGFRGFRAPPDLPGADCFLALHFTNFTKFWNPPKPGYVPSPIRDRIGIHALHLDFIHNPTPHGEIPTTQEDLDDFLALLKKKVDIPDLTKAWPNVTARKPVFSVEMHNVYFWRSAYLKHGKKMHPQSYFNLALRLFEMVNESGLLKSFPTSTYESIKVLEEELNVFNFYLMLEIFSVKRTPSAKEFWIPFKYNAFRPFMKGELKFVGTIPSYLSHIWFF